MTIAADEPALTTGITGTKGEGGGGGRTGEDEAGWSTATLALLH